MAWGLCGLMACTGGLYREGASEGTVTGAGEEAGAGDAGAQTGEGDGDAPYGFAPLTLAQATRKVRLLLTAQAPTVAEQAKVLADPNALTELVTEWLTTPAYQDIMTNFFSNTFQQTGVLANEIVAQYFTFADFVGPDRRVLDNMSQSFGRTAMAIVNQGAPFNTTMTTTSFMMTPPLMMFLALMDERVTADNGGVVETFINKYPNFQFTLTSRTIPLTESVDPTSANYTIFQAPQLASVSGTCAADHTVTKTNNSIFKQYSLATELYMFLAGHSLSYLVGEGICSFPAQTIAVSAGDYNNWRMVTFRQPKSGEDTQVFYDYPAISKATTLVLNTPRVGFYTTPAFFANWNTNNSNLARVTANQALIVALGSSFNGQHNIAPASLASVDPQHSPTNSPCFQCHETLDPMRQFYRQAYSLNFSIQTNSVQTNLPGEFAFDSVSVAGTGIASLGAQFARHPDFATSWTQKLCTWATSAPCLETDPEFVRLVDLFRSSNFNWNQLVVALFTSPIVTYTAPTATTLASGGAFSVVKQRQYCSRLTTVLGIVDPCGLQITTVPTTALAPVQAIASILPADAYGRGAMTPAQPNDPGLFFRAGTENICLRLAPLVVDVGTTSPYSSSDSQGAIEAMVTQLIGILPPDDAPLVAMLLAHNQKALAAGASATEALESTFVVACMSPTMAGIGQ